MIKSVFDSSFRKYGKVVEGYDIKALSEEMMKLPCPDGVVYVPGVEALEATPFAKKMQEMFYGGLPIQVGYCNGHNKMLNALEYHRSSEINVAVGADMILMLGLEADVEPDFTYDTSKVEAFLVPEGTVVEVYATTLHYAPCGVDGNGFRGTVVLPKDTNTDLVAIPEKKGEDALLFAKNKWLIGHAEGGLDEGAFIGLKGKNLSLDDF
ncbi:MAG: DUF4867 family protein [Lachnospiraceae bacterium]|nr:DUF4867 family protein [Lachnospiraceae bacterium]